MIQDYGIRKAESSSRVHSGRYAGCRPLIAFDPTINLGNGREAHLSFPRRRKPPVVAVPAIRNRAS